MYKLDKKARVGLGMALPLLALSAAVSGKALIDHGDPVRYPERAPFNSVVRVTYEHHQCTGSLIARNKVLTAGHCAVQNREKVSPAAYEIERAMDGKQYRVRRVDTPFNGKELKYDFAVLTIINDDPATPIAKLARVTRKTLLTERPSLLAAGYGIDLFEYNPDRLQQGYVVPTSDAYADATVKRGSAWFQARGIPINSVYNPEGVFATCSSQSSNHGDSGGPVFIQRGNKFYQVGSSSWGLTLALKGGYYAVYNGCINAQGDPLPNSRISVFTDLTKNSVNRAILESYL